MTIDINKVRVQLASDDIIDHIELHANLKPILTTFLDRLEAVEQDRRTLVFTLGKECAAVDAAKSEMMEQARLNGMGSEREAALMAKLEAAGKERDIDEQRIADLMAELNRVGHENAELRAKVAAMEKQEPVAVVDYKRGSCVRFVEYLGWQKIKDGAKLYALSGAQQCKNCNGMGDRFDPSGEKIPCDLCESNLEEIRVLVAEAAHDIVSGSDFWLSTSLTAKKIYALPGAKGE